MSPAVQERDLRPHQRADVLPPGRHRTRRAHVAVGPHREGGHRSPEQDVEPAVLREILEITRGRESRDLAAHLPVPVGGDGIVDRHPRVGDRAVVVIPFAAAFTAAFAAPLATTFSAAFAAALATTEEILRKRHSDTPINCTDSFETAAFRVKLCAGFGTHRQNRRRPRSGEGRLRRMGNMKDGTVNLVRIHVFGAFCVTGPDGDDLTPRSEKGQALLALLLTAPQHKRTRSWLQDKLWSRSDPARGATNLRQVLATLRRALGHWDYLLQADRRTVWLDATLVRSDWMIARRTTRLPSWKGSTSTIPNSAPGWRPCAAGRRRARSAARFPRHRATKPGAGASRSTGRPRRVGLSPISKPNSSPFSPGACWKPASRRSRPPATTRAIRWQSMFRWRSRRSAKAATACGFRVLRPERRRILWSTAETIRIAPAAVGDTPSLMALVANAQAAIMREISREADLPPGLDPESRVLARSAQRVFSFDADTLTRTDRSLTELQDGRERGVVLAMRAQISVIRDIERLSAAPQETAEQGLYLAAKAIEADPFNSQVLSAAANAQVFLKWDIDTGAELAEMALHTNRSNPLAWWAQANVALYTQSFDRALECAMTATQLARGTPLQFWCQFQLGLAALAAGQLELARRSLETSAAIAPSFRPPRRYLLALYAHLGQMGRASRMAKDLAALEETFSLDAFARDHDYPVSLARRMGLIDPGVLVDLEHP